MSKKHTPKPSATTHCSFCGKAEKVLVVNKPKTVSICDKCVAEFKKQ